MKRKTKIILGLSSLVVIVVSIFFIQMKKFADGVKEDAKKKKDFNENKISDSTKIIFKKV
jgi:glucose uptake protein GlcU